MKNHAIPRVAMIGTVVAALASPGGRNHGPQASTGTGATSSAATSGSPQQYVQVTFTCPLDTYSVAINWKNIRHGSYVEEGQGRRVLEFKVEGGIDRIEAHFHSASREGYSQKILCKYGTQNGGVHYSYKVNREIIGCETPPAGVREVVCKLKP